MNERIKKLVVESGNGQLRNGKLYPHIGSRTEEDWKKFAELIVRECVSQIQELTPPKVTNENLQELVNSAYTMGLEVGVTKIKKHFGVEE